VENFWAQVKNAPEKLHLCLLSQLLERQRNLWLPARSQSMASWCAVFTL
jgi:hypothetical protein